MRVFLWILAASCSLPAIMLPVRRTHVALRWKHYAEGSGVTEGGWKFFHSKSGLEEHLERAS